ncbi:YheC/YheD family endospore coat-associated protein [Neobacillus drentensis]|uniref:YheC/YheD family endospore coat-associated protein n=1 Tax=Neobacillus drentensis TaxID=220684 RepID=UPI002FFF935B
MDENSIGIILPKRQWNRLAQEELTEDDAFVFQYAIAGEALNLDILFFNIEELQVNERKGNAMMIIDEEIVLLGFIEIPSVIYNPSNYHRKKNNRTIFELAQQTGITLINEKTNIKNKHFLDLMATHPALKDVNLVTRNQNPTSFSFYILGQKHCNHQWDTPIIYAKKDDEVLPFKEAYLLLTNNLLMLEETQEYLFEVSHQILEILHYYYPRIYEIGLQFVLMENGEIRIKSTCPILTLVKDISFSNQKVAGTILKWPIELAKEIMDLNNDDQTMHTNIGETEANVQESNLELHHDNITPFVKKSSPHFENVWVEFKVFHDNEMKMKLPDRLTEKWREQPEIVKFGVNEETCHFEIYEDAIPLRHNSYQNPVELFVSDALVKLMHLPVDLVYQIQFSERKAIIGPTIGFLLGEKNHVYNLDYMEKFNDRFGEYHRYGGVTIAFSASSVDWEKRIAYGMIYDPVKKHWRYDSTPIPSTIYRRNFHQKKDDIRQLVELTDNHLFNSYHFKKSDLYLLKNNPELKQHLPATILLDTMEELINFVIENGKVILKPVSLSRGRGIFIVELDSETEGFSLFDYRNMTKVEHRLKDKEELQALLEEMGIFDQEYLFQTYIPLLKVNNRSLDVRVVMQKYNKRKWQCSGIECRVAREDEDLTNIARGGEAMTLETVIKSSTQGLNFSLVHRNILNLCQRFCRIMDQKNEHFAEFGIDIALDEHGFPWILEANIYPSFKGFKAMDYDTYLKIRTQPMFYAVQIQGFQILDEDAYGNKIRFRERAFL